ncbi:hypothetical protein ACHAW5_009490 [Stephanodiscus triporus]|uniref:Uncharacterized protein n=1 Tax=Stephanodiscus triporus TaxID=2934178 RepID=A0ABD3NJG7_9STRA
MTKGLRRVRRHAEGRWPPTWPDGDNDVVRETDEDFLYAIFLDNDDGKYRGQDAIRGGAVAYHPFNDGIWSALLQTYKIIPKFKKYAKEHGGSGQSPVIISTCSVKQRMCTYYMEYAKEFTDMGRLERRITRYIVGDLSRQRFQGTEEGRGSGGGRRR